MGLIEDALRREFTARVANAPAVEDLASRAIRGGRKMRWRRSVVGSAAAFIAVVVSGAGIVALVRATSDVAGVGRPDTSATVVVEALPVDVLNGTLLSLAGGGAIPLTGLPPARQAWRATDGWLVETADPKTFQHALWLVDTDGSVLLAEGDRVVVGQGSGVEPVVAWSADGQVSVAHYGNRGLVPVGTTPAAGLEPVAIVGMGVLLGGLAPGASQYAYDMWFPVRGNYEPAARTTNPIIGISGDGLSLFGLAGGVPPCLVILSISSFAPQHTRCDLEITPNHRVFASPDKIWLVAIGGGRVDLYDLTSVWRIPVPEASWPINAGNAEWLRDGSFVVGDRSQVWRIHPDQLGRVETTPIAPGDGPTLLPVVDLRW